MFPPSIAIKNFASYLMNLIILLHRKRNFRKNN
uniref:Uncharacterized protein n=1 Tax=Bacteriophage sp. TaxID=38018 RepID=A0A8D9UHS0_9VIRU|nr:MAG TPA: hypothetical protein [Bacteriophage sp.]